MTASLTFTYGTEREDIYKYKSKDAPDKLLRNSLDYNMYMFHNSETTYIKKAKEYLKDFNLTIVEGYGTYPSVLEQALIFLKNKGVTKLVFLQDDVFTNAETCNVKIMANLADFIKTTDMPYVNLEITCDDPARKILEDRKDFKVIDTDTAYHKQIRWSFDDSPYYAKMDFVMNTIYDSTYYSYPDIWSAEWHLRRKFDMLNVPRYVTDRCFFRRANFVGRHNHNRVNELKYLEEHFT